MNELLTNWVASLPINETYESMLVSMLSIALILFIAAISYFAVKRIIVRLINKVITSSDSNLDDVLVEHNVFNYIAYLVPVSLVINFIPKALGQYPSLSDGFVSIATICFVIVVVMLLDSLIDSLLAIYNSFEIAKQNPLQNIAQVAKLLTYFIAIIVVVSLVIGESPLKLFAGLGAMTAILMLIFRDPILGFVAGLQLNFNNMVGVGDWVDMPQHNASGDIMEIGLTTVKVRNFDNTITTVPTQSLINESFKNWRGMQESSGRRIKRAINIDVNSIQFCDEEALNRYSKVDYIKDYIQATQESVNAFNQDNVRDTESLVNGRRMTNIGTFRAYILAYLQNHPNINQQLTLLVRQLAPTESGLPIEIYAFSSEKDWTIYEAIQADIFDHLFAVAKEFDLRVFQKPTGSDLQTIVNNKSRVNN